MNCLIVNFFPRHSKYYTKDLLIILGKLVYNPIYIPQDATLHSLLYLDIYWNGGMR